MTLHDDPRLTRYALGEMTDDTERAAFEAALDDGDRAEIAAIRALGGTLASALSPDAFSGGTGIPACVAAQPESAPRQRSRRTHWMLAAAAAVTIAGIGFTAGVLSTRREPTSAVAMRTVGAATLLYSNENRLAAPNSGPSATSEVKKIFAAELQVAAAAHPSLDRAKSISPTIVIQRQGEQQSLPPLEVDAAISPALAAPSGKLMASSSDRVANTPALQQLSISRAPAVATKSEFFKRSPYDANDSFLQPVDDDGKGVIDSARNRRDERSAQSAESYAPITENPFTDPRVTPLSTFGVDVDTASYANVRRFLTAGQKPPADAVRVEELINYFPTSDAPPTDGKPFAVHAEVARCPWNATHDLVRVALKAKEVAMDKRPTSNLVFLIDVSGSMNEPDKLPLVKRGLERLVDQLNENDRVAIVVYAGNSGLVLPSTNASDKATIRQAIDRLEAGGSTNGGQGIELAYATAAANFVRGGANRVILCTDGDFNVGVTDRGSLLELIQQKAKAGTFLSVLGFGTGNVKDDTMEMLADKGNGNYAYIDTDREAQKVLVQQASGTLVTVAKDVKIQVEFNPAAVASYRLIGYENRALAKEDFNNDLKDAGEIGAGHNVVALYEIERAAGRARFSGPDVDKLKYQSETSKPAPDANAELLTLKLRYKAPDAPLEQGVSQLIEQPLSATDRAIEQASADFQFDAAVAGFGMLLRGSSARGECDWATVTRLAHAGLGADAGGYRAEFLTLVEKAKQLAP